MVLSGCRSVFDGRLCDDAPATAVEGYPSCVIMIDDDSLAVGVVDDRRVNASDRSVVDEGSMIPTPAIVSMARKAKSIVNAAVVTYVRPPIARVPDC